jgi:hypothetical protein
VEGAPQRRSGWLDEHAASATLAAAAATASCAARELSLNVTCRLAWPCAAAEGRGRAGCAGGTWPGGGADAGGV